ncbi:MAG: D-alanine--D-alanine ligase [Myxococcales bacterium]|nr:D-alanine--D-alanine ligase [Myxococcales bacterium]
MTASQAKRVALLMGGQSREREVSLNTGRAITQALRDGGHDVTPIDWSPSEVNQLLEGGFDAVFLALHGGYGEDGSVQGLLNVLGIPYTGAGVMASAIAMDKVRTKALFTAAGLATPVSLTDTQLRDGASIEFPVVVKPSREGSSVGISIVREQGEFDAAIAAARWGEDAVLIETFIDGPEVSVGLFDGEVLGTVQIQAKHGFYDYSAKYQSQDTRYLIPPELPTHVVEAIEATAAAAYRVIGCRGVARIDLMVDGEKPWLLEVNTLPGMTATSLVPKLAAARGESFVEFCDRMLASARTDAPVGAA